MIYVPLIIDEVAERADMEDIHQAFIQSTNNAMTLMAASNMPDSHPLTKEFFSLTGRILDEIEEPAST